MTPAILLPFYEGLRIDSITAQEDAIVLRIATVAPSAPCPKCARAATRVHSHYQRTLNDMPWNKVRVRIQLTSRKFFCDYTDCNQAIFTEPIPQLAKRHACKTHRLDEALALIGYALGGEAGARLATGLGFSVSPDTLLNRVRQQGSPSLGKEPVRAVGVDDWAFCKGRAYGTILVDLDKHQLLDLLPDRSAQTLAQWLKSHPEVEFISRDRASAYADGAKIGAPQARQVADRFHVLKNLVEALEHLVLRYQRPLQQACRLVSTPTVSTKATTTGVEGTVSPSQAESQARRQRRLARYEQVVQWYRQGVPIHQIARNLKMHRRTVRQFVRASEFPERATPRQRPRQEDSHSEYLQERWASGCHNAAQLFREIQERGYVGCQSALRRYLLSWRAPLPEGLRDQRGSKMKAAASVRFSPRTTAWLLLGYAKNKDTRRQSLNAAFLKVLIELCPAIGVAQALSLQFFLLFRQRRSADLQPWIERVLSSDLLELKSFARGLSEDFAAVSAGIDTCYSNGQAEGQVNRLKLIKRSMYGRAGFTLLQARVLPMRNMA